MSETSVQMKQMTLVQQIRSWITSPSGLTILFTLAIAVVATIDRGIFVMINTIVTGGMWALLAAGLSLVFGVMNVVNFAHGEFFMIGGLAAYFTFNPIRNYLVENPSQILSALAPFLAILVATIVGAIMGVIIEILVFRPLRQRTKEQWVMNAFLLTVGISVILINGHQLLFGPNFKGVPNYWDVEPVKIGSVSVTFDRIVSFVLAMIVMAVFWYFLRRTRTGRAIRAVSQDENGARMVGINLNNIQVLTMALSSALAALAGGSLLFLFPSYPTVGTKPLYIAWYVVIIAGLGNVAGALVGGFIVGLLNTLTSLYVGVGWEDVIPTAFIMLILLIKPSGLFGSEVKGIHEQ